MALGKDYCEDRHLSDQPIPETVASRRRWKLILGGVVIVLIGLFAAVGLISSGSVAKASPNEEAQLACDTCHTVRLGAHAALGAEENRACHSCHANPNMSALQLSSGVELALANSAPLCQQCHQQRYQEWVDGTHGFPGYEAGMLSGDPSTSTNCTTCHNPHEPRIILSNITLPHPDPVPAPPSPPKDPLIILGISVGILGIALVGTLWGRARE